MVSDLQRATIFVPDMDGGFYRSLDEIEPRLHEKLRPSFNAFKQNLLSTEQAAGMPLHFALSAAQGTRLALLTVAEQISTEFLRDGLSAEERTQGSIRARASEELGNEVTQTPGALVRPALDHLEQLLKNEQFLLACRNLLRQATVLTWSAMEVLADDVFTALLNAAPSLLWLLEAEKATNKLFNLKLLPLDVLREHGFDLSNRLGDVLISSARIDSLLAIRTVFTALSPGHNEFQDVLRHRRLIQLNQRRHLIVHRFGIVDREYVRNTGELCEPGAILIVRAGDLKRYLEAVRNVGRILFVVGTELLTKHDNTTSAV